MNSIVDIIFLFKSFTICFLNIIKFFFSNIVARLVVLEYRLVIDAGRNCLCSLKTNCRKRCDYILSRSSSHFLLNESVEKKEWEEEIDLRKSFWMDHIHSCIRDFFCQLCSELTSGNISRCSFRGETMENITVAGSASATCRFILTLHARLYQI